MRIDEKEAYRKKVERLKDETARQNQEIQRERLRKKNQKHK